MSATIYPQSRRPRPTVSVKQAARDLGIPARTLYHYCNKGLIPHVRVVRRILLLRETVDALLAAGELPVMLPDPGQW